MITLEVRSSYNEFMSVLWRYKEATDLTHLVSSYIKLYFFDVFFFLLRTGCAGCLFRLLQSRFLTISVHLEIKHVIV